VKILINHLTRMQKGFMCVAGIDRARCRHIRPIVGGLMKTELLAEHGGPFALRRIVELGETAFAGRMPEIEDRTFDPAAVEVLDELDKASFWQACAELASRSLGEIFGPDLQRIQYGDNEATAAVPETFGLRSLGCYWAHQPRIEVECRGGRPRIRFEFTEAQQRFSVPVTDIRCYRPDHVTPDEVMVQRLNGRLQRLPEVLTSIGLSRAYQHRPEDPPRHWLQINNVHLPVA